MPLALIVDDDPISLRFLQAALKTAGCESVTANGCSTAMTAAAENAFDLVLLDRNLPDGSGSELLAMLRARAIACPAIATSAEMTTSIEAQLRAAGFVACIEKPIALSVLQQMLQPWLPAIDSIPLLDDDGGLTAVGGDRNILHSLRAMLVQELATLRDDLTNERITGEALLDRLHRLRASCGFCGAPKLAAATTALQQALRSHPSDATRRRGEFIAGCAETMAALGS